MANVKVPFLTHQSKPSLQTPISQHHLHVKGVIFYSTITNDSVTSNDISSETFDNSVKDVNYKCKQPNIFVSFK